jgi:hypothetical protein
MKFGDRRLGLSIGALPLRFCSLVFVSPAVPIPSRHLSRASKRTVSAIVKFWFWFLWSIDAIIAAIALYFFFSLAAGGRVGSFNIVPWLALLAALAAVIGGSAWFRSAGQHAVAIVLVLLLAIPGALFVLCFLLLLILHPNFH